MLVDQHQHQPQVLLTGLLACLLLAGALVACQQKGPSQTPTCPSGDPLRGIYSPKRLTVLDACRRFAGTVVATDRKSDGDLHILLRPDPGNTDYLNEQNVNAGGMVVEIVPGQDLPEPQAGDHLAVLGTWVLDEHNGWNEIHPVWAITNLETGLVSRVLPPDPPLYSGDSND